MLCPTHCHLVHLYVILYMYTGLYFVPIFPSHLGKSSTVKPPSSGGSEGNVFAICHVTFKTTFVMPTGT